MSDLTRGLIVGVLLGLIAVVQFSGASITASGYVAGALGGVIYRLVRS